MLRILVLAIACCLVHGYNYGDNQQPQPQQQATYEQQPVRGSFMRPPPSDSKWSSGFAAPADSQDGSYIIRPQFARPQSTLQQRNPNFRSEPAALRSGHNLPNTGFVNNGDLAGSERANQRLLLPVSGGVSAGGLPKSGAGGHVPASGQSGVQSKDVQQPSVSALPKTESSPAQQVSSGGALPLSSLSRLRPQQASSSPYFYRSETLEQMINRRSADKFLGPAFIQQQLISQKGDNKFLRVYGKEEKEINGTIEVKKGGLVNANLEEVKDGRFSVMDRQSRKVGDVQMHRDVEKHLKMTEHNGVTNVELEKNSNAELNVERDINLAPRFRPYGQPNNSPNPSHKIRVHLEQNQNSRANVEVAKNQPQQKSGQSTTTTAAPDNNNNGGGRFRRDTQQAASLP